MTKTSYRQQIITTLKSALENITIANGYGLTVAGVVEWEDWHDMSSNDTIEIRDLETSQADGYTGLLQQLIIQVSFVTDTIEKCRLFIADLNLFCKNYDKIIANVELMDIDESGEQIEVQHEKSKVFIYTTNLIINYKIEKWTHYIA